MTLAELIDFLVENAAEISRGQDFAILGEETTLEDIRLKCLIYNRKTQLMKNRKEKGPNKPKNENSPEKNKKGKGSPYKDPSRRAKDNHKFFLPPNRNLFNKIPDDKWNALTLKQKKKVIESRKKKGSRPNNGLKSLTTIKEQRTCLKSSNKQKEKTR